MFDAAGTERTGTTETAIGGRRSLTFGDLAKAYLEDYELQRYRSMNTPSRGSATYGLLDGWAADAITGDAIRSISYTADSSWPSRHDQPGNVGSQPHVPTSRFSVASFDGCRSFRTASKRTLRARASSSTTSTSRCGTELPPAYQTSLTSRTTRAGAETRFWSWCGTKSTSLAA